MCAAMDVANNNKTPNNVIIEKLKTGDSERLGESPVKSTANICQEGPSKLVAHDDQVKQPLTDPEPRQHGHQSNSRKATLKVKKLSRKAKHDLEMKNMKMRNKQLQKQCDDVLKSIRRDTLIITALETRDIRPLEILRDEIRKSEN